MRALKGPQTNKAHTDSRVSALNCNEYITMSDGPAAETLTTISPFIPVRSNTDMDWSLMAGDFSARFEHLVANELRSDMFVLIKKTGQLVPAHQFAIGSANKRLRWSVNGRLSDGSDIDGKPVLMLSNMQPDACLAFLQYLYTNDCPQLSVDSAFTLLRYACPTYGPLPGLKLICVSAMLYGMNAAFVLQLYPDIFNRASADLMLVEGCVRHLQYFVTSMCTLESAADGTNLFQMPVPALEKLCDRTDMHILSDVVLFRGLLYWARHRLRKLGIPYGTAAERLAYQQRLRIECTGRLDQIRLSTLTLKQFNQCMDDLEAPPVGSDCGYGPGFFTSRELRELSNRRNNKYIERRCEPDEYRPDSDDSDSEIIEDPGCKLPYHYTLREPMPMDQLMWYPDCHNLVPVDDLWSAFGALLSDSEADDEDEKFRVGAFAAIRVRPSDTRRQRVVLAGLRISIGMHRVRSVQLLRDGECINRAAGAGLAFRYHREESDGEKCRIWLESPERLEPNAQYRLVVTAREPGATCLLSTPAQMGYGVSIDECPFVVPDVVTIRRPNVKAGCDERLVDKCNVNMLSLYYSYLWDSE